ncbi:MAG: DMT family transporter [Chitinophagaceae bacterium]|nr:MAG: DMT family transporter [Chitinophagaceae bacterium]
MKKAFFQLHLAVFLAGFTGVLGKLITLNEGLLVWYRLLISAVTMWIIFSISKKIKRILITDALQIIGIGFIAAMHWVTFYGAIKYANISVALVCFSAVGFFTALMEPLLLRVRIKWSEVLLGILVMVGIYIIFHFDPEYKVGIILGLLSALLLAVMVILIRIVLQKINIETVLTYQMSGGFLSLTILLPFYLQYFPVQNILPSSTDWMWLFVLSWFCSVWAFQLSTSALKKLSAFTVNLTYNLEPVYGILLAFIVYSENKILGSSFFVGLSLIMASLVIHVWIILNQQKREKLKGKVDAIPLM